MGEYRLRSDLRGPAWHERLADLAFGALALAFGWLALAGTLSFGTAIGIAGLGVVWLTIRLL